MRARENYTPHLAVAFGLTLAILVSFQVYLLREPGRIQAEMKNDQAQAVAAGQKLFDKNCSPCHGAQGEGDIGPSLNDKHFLDNTSDDTIFSVISSGVPGTQMPAWNQSHGGPLTNDDVLNLVAFVRAWQATAPDRQATPVAGDPGRGARIFANVCIVCHGDNGKGTARAPALNDPARLSQLDDAWYRTTITKGRLAQGMPTWGTVLSPDQVNDLIALLDTWRTAAAVAAVPTTAPSGQDIARPSNAGGPGPAANLTGNAAAGAQIFTANCQKCHGPTGTGGVQNPGSSDGTVPSLNPIDSTLPDQDPKVYVYNLDLFLEHGSTPEGPNPKLQMPAWGDQKKLTPQQIADVIAYVMSLNPAPATAATAAPSQTAVPTPQASGPTPVPTVEVARPSNEGGPGPAADLTGDAAAGVQVFTANCQKCHGPTGTGGVENPGSSDGTVPPLNPIDSTLVNADAKTYVYNLDLFLEHGSTPEGPNPKLQMPAWGDQKKLTPQQIADVIAYVMSLNPAPAATQAPAATEAPTPAAPDIARPSNAGGAGPAAGLTGDAAAGAQVFTANCQKCHGPTGTGGVQNPGSTDGTVPPLNPIDSTLVNADAKTYVYNLDLFLEHGSTPEGPNPKLQMPAWGDQKKLTPQQIADVIAYVMSLNPAPATAAATATTAPTAAAPDIARPSNAGGPGPAADLTGDAAAGAQVFTANCQKCHGPTGTGGVQNPGSTDGTVPPLNPIDSTLVSADAKTYVYNLDLFLEHGSTPEGPNPKLQMPAWGDQKKLTPQQIADVIAYLISLNPPK